MALTLAEASKLSNDMLLQGVMETIVRESPILQSIPFIEIVGNGLTYNQEKNLSDVDFYDVGDSWTESTPTFDQKTANLKIMGGDADVDNFLKATRSNVQDLETAVIELKAKALKNKFEDVFIYGDSAVNSKQFDGLRKLINTGTAGSQVVSAGTSGAILNLSMLDQLIDSVKGGRPDLLLMSRRTRRKINALVRASGGMMETNRDNYGNFIQYWDGIPLAVSDFILDTHTVAGGVETAITGGVCSSVYALQMGEGALCGLTAPGFITIDPIGSLETKDASRNRIKWYVSVALFSAIKAAALIGVQDN
jgi:hypothetical protein